MLASLPASAASNGSWRFLNIVDGEEEEGNQEEQ
jgi:hypothetical protein